MAEKFKCLHYECVNYSTDYYQRLMTLESCFTKFRTNATELILTTTCAIQTD